MCPGRALLQNKCADSQIIFHTTQRFDTGMGGPLMQEWLELLDEAVRTMPNLRFVANNPYEMWYAHKVQKATFITAQTIRPTGHWPDDVQLAFEAGDPDANAVVLQNYEPYLNEILLSNITNMNIPVDLLHHGRYGGAHGLAQYRCVIQFPYQVSVMAMYENLAAGVVLIVPSLSFYRSIAQALVNHGVGLYLNDLDTLETDPAGWAATEWWGPYFADVLVHFESWEHLERILSGQFEFHHHKQMVVQFMSEHSHQVVKQWSEILWCNCHC